MTELLNSLGWALLHSLWQGCLAMCCVVAFRGIAEKSAPSVRYTIQLAVLAGCLLAFFVTFGLYQNSSQSFESGFTLTLSDTMSQAAALQISPSQGIKITSQNLTLSIAAYAPLLGLFWCLGFAVIGFKYMTAYSITQRLRTTGLSEPSDFWTHRFKTLRLNSGALEAARLYVSENVTGPLTIGFLKPIVLVPVGFLSGLPRDQVEAVLLHELAHIRRYDYLVNLFQTAIKTVLFFNPFIHYISRKIDIDREQACDDFAVAQTQNPHALALGLARLRLTAPSHNFIMAADNGDTPLTERLGRLTGQESRQRSRPEHLFIPLIALMVMAGVYMTASPSAKAHPAAQSFEIEKNSQEVYTIDTRRIDGRDITLKTTANGKRWILIDGDWIDIDLSPESMSQLPTTMPVPPVPPKPPLNYNNQNDRANFLDRMAQFQTDMAYFEADLERYFSKNKKLDKAQMKRIEKEVMKAAKRAKIDVESIEFRLEAEMERSEKERERALEQAERQIERAVKESERQRERSLKQAEKQMERALEKAERIGAATLRSAERSQVKPAHAERARIKADKHHAKTDALRESFYDYLIKDGYIGSRNQTVVLKSANKMWTVNDVVIPSEKEAKYCELLARHGIPKSLVTKVKLEPGSMQIVSENRTEGKTQNHKITYGQFEAHEDKSKTHTAPKAPISPGYPQPINYETTKVSQAFVSPVSSQHISAKFGQAGSLWPTVHHGVDFKGKIGDPIVASAEGVIEKASYEGNWGNRVIIAHKDGYHSLYAHMASMTVSAGQKVKMGEKIGTVGSTGQSTGPHLHFEIRKDGTRLDPLSKLK